MGNNGVNVLVEEDGITKPKSDWTSKNRDVKKRYIEHEIRLADFLIALERAIATNDSVELISFQEILAGAPLKTRERYRPDGWRVTIPYHGTNIDTNIFPDAIFGLRVSEPTTKEYFFFVEIDRATMPVIRTNPRQTSFYKKLLAYNSSRKLWKLDKRTAPFGFVNARVLSVTTTPERGQSLIEATEKATGAGQDSKYFLFTDFETLNQTENVFELQWLDGRGETVTICP